MISAFQRASASILSILGQDAFFRGETTPHKVNIEHNVQVTDDEQMISQRDVATIPLAAMPKKGDVFVHPDGTYFVDKLYQDNGANKRYIVTKV
jgi:hypothetical protein